MQFVIYQIDPIIVFYNVAEVNNMYDIFSLVAI